MISTAGRRLMAKGNLKWLQYTSNCNPSPESGFMAGGSHTLDAPGVYEGLRIHDRKPHYLQPMF